MMLKDSLASKLKDGTAKVPGIVSWWPRHSAACEIYMNTCLAGGFSEEHRADLMKLSQEWEAKVPSSARCRAGSSLGLMCEHSALEVALIDATAAQDPEKIERTGLKLMDNANAHAARYEKFKRTFPKHRFVELMRSHISISVSLINAQLDRDRGMFRKYRELSDENSAALAAFSAEWF